jgi:VacB/RNase II family 3'-5' exoribonuclease
MLESKQYVLGIVEDGDRVNTYGYTQYYAKLSKEMRMGAENGDIVLCKIIGTSSEKTPLPVPSVNIYRNIINPDTNSAAYIVEVESIIYDANSYKIMLCSKVGKNYIFRCGDKNYRPNNEISKYIPHMYYVCITTKLNDRVSVFRKIGIKGTTEFAINTVLFQNRIYINEFRENYVEDLKNMNWTAERDKTYSGRTHLQNECVFTVDPADCKDRDDALSIKRIGKYYIVDVHIADVSHFVKQDSYFDKVASNRCNTLYLPNGIITMLPDILCENYCSLNPDEEKFVITCRLFYDRYGILKNSVFFRSVIMPCRKLSYEEAQHIIDGGKITGHKSLEIMSSILDLNRLAIMLREERIENGALMMCAPEMKMIVSDGRMTGYDIKIPTEANNFVEEFMIAANTEAAKRILQYCSNSALLRVHTGTNAFSGIVCKKARDLGITVKYDGKPPIGSLNMVISEILKSTLHRAEYSPGNRSGHKGLALIAYTHFTSPIRRYADIIVHRQLLLSMGLTRECTSLINIHDICENMNSRVEISRICYRLCNEIYLREYLSKGLRYKVIVSAYITRLAQPNVIVYVPCLCACLTSEFPKENFGDNSIRVIIGGNSYVFRFLDAITIEICENGNFDIRLPGTKTTGVLKRLN